MTNITVLDSAGATQNLATGSGSGSAGSPFVSPAATALGGLADSAVTNPASSGSVISLLKGLLTNVPALVVGHGTAAAAQRVELPTDGTGVVGLNAGVNIIGKFGIDQTTPGTTNLVAANMTSIGGTAFSIGQAKKVNSMPITQSGGVLITGATLTRQANTTAYADGQHVSNASPAALAAAVAPANGVPVSLVRCRLQSSHVSSIANGVFKVFVFEQAPTSIAADGATFTCTGINCAGYFDVTLDQIFTDISLGVGYPHLGAAINVTPAAGSQNIYYLIAAHAAYTPASGETLTVLFEVL